MCASCFIALYEIDVTEFSVVVFFNTLRNDIHKSGSLLTQNSRLRVRHYGEAHKGETLHFFMFFLKYLPLLWTRSMDLRPDELLLPRLKDCECTGTVGVHEG
ncbi:hypothetical protein TRVL_02306 [Trypanosoma vivax]|nr:hypothetical protein TRVL_02306 [Trypanosoma vivax]